MIQGQEVEKDLSFETLDENIDFLPGRRFYRTPRLWHLQVHDNKIEIIAKDTNWIYFVVGGTLLMLGAVGSWIFRDVKPILLMAVASGVGLPLVFVLSRDEVRRGPLLRMDRAMGTMELPRAGAMFSTSDIISFLQLDATDRDDSYRVELDVIVSKEGRRFRYHVIGDNDRRTIDEVRDALVSVVDKPIWVVERDWRGREKRYCI